MRAPASHQGRSALAGTALLGPLRGKGVPLLPPSCPLPPPHTRACVRYHTMPPPRHVFPTIKATLTPAQAIALQLAISTITDHGQVVGNR